MSRNLAADLCFEKPFSEEGEPGEMADVDAELQQYEVPVPGGSQAPGYAADRTEEPRGASARASLDGGSVAGSAGDSIQGSPPELANASHALTSASALDAALEAARSAQSQSQLRKPSTPPWGIASPSLPPQAPTSAPHTPAAAGQSVGLPPGEATPGRGSSSSSGGRGMVKSPGGIGYTLSIKDLVLLGDSPEGGGHPQPGCGHRHRHGEGDPGGTPCAAPQDA